MMKINGKNLVCGECPLCEGLDYGFNIAEECGCDPQCEMPSKKSKHRNGGRAYRREMKRLKKKKRMGIISHGYKPTAGYVDWDFVNGEWVPVGTYIKYPKNSNMQKYFKRYSNGINRRREVPAKGNGYRKNFDYWWTLY